MVLQDTGVLFLWTQGDAGSGDPQPAPASLADPACPDEAWGSGWAADFRRLQPWAEALFPASGEGPQLNGLAAAAPAACGPVIACGPCSSGFDVAWRLAAQGLLPPWGSVLAVSQWAGRGQMRRAWQSPSGNVHGVMRLGHGLGGAGEPPADMLPMLAGLALALVLEDLGLSPRIKWPNDVLVDERKIAGILVEERSGTGPGEPPVLLVGMGVNLVAAPDAELLRRDSAAPAGSLHDRLGGGQGQTGPLGLWPVIAARLRQVLHAARDRDAAAEFRSAVEARLAWLGREVEVRDGPFDKTMGRIIGLEASGALRLAVHGRETVCRSGSVYPVNGPRAT